MLVLRDEHFIRVLGQWRPKKVEKLATSHPKNIPEKCSETFWREHNFFTCNPSVVCIPGSALTSAESICDAHLPGDVAYACPGYLGVFPRDCKWVPAMGTCKNERHQTSKQPTNQSINQSINHANNLIFAKKHYVGAASQFFLSRGSESPGWSWVEEMGKQAKWNKLSRRWGWISGWLRLVAHEHGKSPCPVPACSSSVTLEEKKHAQQTFLLG